ncbi:MAG: hypothetical protein ACLGIO_02900 [Acidimicrobiia bacterium]
MATAPPLDVSLAPLNGPPRTLEQWLTTFHLVFVAVDPFTYESAWLLPTANRVLLGFQEADCRIAWLVAGTPEDCREFLGPLSREILTFADPDREAIKAFGLERLPALVHVGLDGSVIGAAEGWDPAAWRAVTQSLARMMAWSAPTIPAAGDPGPYPGSPALG